MKKHYSFISHPANQGDNVLKYPAACYHFNYTVAL